MALSSPSDGNRNGRRTNPFASGSSAPAKVVVSSDTANELMDGIGILNFLEGRSYFITGATGLLGKAKHNIHFPERKKSIDKRRMSVT